MVGHCDYSPKVPKILAKLLHLPNRYAITDECSASPFKVNVEVHPRTGHEGPEWEQTKALLFLSPRVLDGSR